MDEKRTHWWPSIDTMLIVISLTVILLGVWIVVS